MRLGVLNLTRTLHPFFENQMKSAFNCVSHEYMQDKLKETRSRVMTTRMNAKNTDSGSKRTEYLSERNLVTERFKPKISGLNNDLLDAMSLPDNNDPMNTDRETVEAKHDMGKSQQIPKIALKGSLVTKTQDHSSLALTRWI